MADTMFRRAYQFVLYGDTPPPGKSKLWRGEQGAHKASHADPNDTLDGVIQTTYDAYRASGWLAPQSVFQMNPAEREAIYRDYWQDSRAAEVEGAGKPMLALVHFATYFNLPPREAVKLLQRSVDASPDGALGPKTLAAVTASEDRQAAVRYCGHLVRYYKRIATDAGPGDRHAPNLAGWLLRVSAIQRELGL